MRLGKPSFMIMSRNSPHPSRRKRMEEARPQAGDFIEKTRSLTVDSPSRSDRGVLVMRRHDHTTTQESLDESLASALLAQDKDLAQILQEVDKISKNLKSNSVDTQALSGALHRTVLCAIKQSLLDRELRSLALTDDLTCIYNRRAFYALAAQQLKVARRMGRGLLLFFADVDNLKNINDTFGHREGDVALIRAADALEQTFRNSDILARLGGDEFAVLALDASSQDQDAILRRLDQQLKAVSAEEPRYKLSLSMGMARFEPKAQNSLADLLSMADRAMYEEKKAHPKAWMTQL
jgi:diguanylate cyclase (GGDEF)-like protein